VHRSHSWKSWLSIAGLLATGTCAAANSSNGYPRGAITPESTATKAGCSACHALDHKVLGPSYQDIAARYKEDPKAAEALSATLRSGSRGVWGALAMQPVTTTTVSDADLAAIVAWILSQ
jgi:cytochrome c